MKKFFKTMFTILILASPFSLLHISAQATSNLCVADFPDNIFDSGVAGTGYLGFKNADYLDGRPVNIAITPMIKYPVAIAEKVKAMGKDIKVSIVYNVENGLESDFYRAAALTSNPNQIDNSRGSWLAGIGIPGYGVVNRAGNGYMRMYSVTPGTTLFTTATILTPNCEARTFTSGKVTVPEMLAGKSLSPQILDLIKSYATDFTQVDAFNRYVTLLGNTPLNINKNLTFTDPGQDLPRNLNFPRLPEWRKCNAVHREPAQATNKLISFVVNDPSKSFTCKIPVYGLFAGEIATISEATFIYQAPTPVGTPKGSVAQKITCLKGSSKKNIVGINPKCPAGYKKA